MEKRIKTIFDLASEPLDAIVLINDVEPNLDIGFFYATGVEAGLFENCAAILFPDGRMDLVTTALEETSAQGTRANIKIIERKGDRERLIKESLRSVKRVGVNGAGLTFRKLQDLRSMADVEIVDVWKAVEAAKQIKDEREIGHIRKACQIASKVGAEIPSFIEEGMTEYQAAAEIGYRMQKLGASGPSFPTNASFGANAAEPHHLPGEDKLKKGQFVLFDYGALYKRYCSDITRTFVFHKATQRQRDMYEVVAEAQRAGIEAMREGVGGKEVDAVARQVIDSSPFKGLFIHSLGHALGLAVHDGGRMSPESDLILKENMVITVEPGVYIHGEGGVRIEDDVLVTKTGCELLTTAPKEFRVI